MARISTCIICGGSAGSGEHVFPASLGGRRTNRRIYCGLHDNAYSPLADVLAKQLSPFNARLGIITDHKKKPVSTTVTDIASGRKIRVDAVSARLVSPLIKTIETDDGQVVAELSFNSVEEAKRWREEMAKKGVEVASFKEVRRVTRYGGGAHAQIQLGGNEEGLRAIAYIAQTFFAQAYPEAVRLPAFDALKAYTLHNRGGGFVWWDFSPPADLPENHFPFGHRVIVGLDQASATAYARISFFSTLHFALILADLPVEASGVVITDIDPLAEAPPHDIVRWPVDEAVGRVFRPDDPAAALAEAIHSGRAMSDIGALLRRILKFDRDRTAARLLERLGDAATLPDTRRNAFFERLVAAESQRVLNLMRHAIEDMKQRASTPIEQGIAEVLDGILALDPEAENGLSPQATEALKLGCRALARQMSADCKAGQLDQARMELLIGGGPGAFAALAPIMQMIIAIVEG